MSRSPWHRDGDLWRWHVEPVASAPDRPDRRWSIGSVARGNAPRTWHWEVSGDGWEARGKCRSCATARLLVACAVRELGRLSDDAPVPARRR